MKVREYFSEHVDENLGWCRPYCDDAMENYIIMCDGDVNGVHLNGLGDDVYDHDGIMSIISSYAKTRPDYHLRHDEWGMTDLEIALGTMRDVGCALCPFNDICAVMDEDTEF